MSTIAKQIAKSAGWTIAMRLADRSIGFVSTLILARMLVPADFGLVAMATVIVGLLDTLTAFGFEWAVIQRQTTERRYLDTAWSLNVVIGLVNASILLLSIPLAVHFFGEQRLPPIMAVFALAIAVSGFHNVGMVLFEQGLQFRRVFVMTFCKKLFSFAVTITIALAYRSYWALVLGTLAGALAEVALGYLLSPYRPRPTLHHWRDVFSFSKWLYATNILGFVNQRGTTFIIGRLSGPSALGVYNMSYELGNLPTSELVNPVFRALFPGYSKLRNDPVELRDMVDAAIGLTVLLVAPAAMGIAALSSQLVHTLLGPQWDEATRLLPLFAITGAFGATLGPVWAVNLALGRAALSAKTSALVVLTALPVFTWLLRDHDVLIATIGLACVSTTISLGYMVMTARHIGLGGGRVLRGLWRPLAAALLMGGTVHALAAEVWRRQAAWPEQVAVLLGLVAFGVALYVGTVALLWRSAACPEGAETRVLIGLRAVRRRIMSSNEI